MLNIPVIPYYRPDPTTVAVIRAWLAYRNHSMLLKAVRAARSVA